MSSTTRTRMLSVKGTSSRPAKGRESDRCADRAQDVVDLRAQEDQGRNRNDGDEREDQRVLSKALAFAAIDAGELGNHLVSPSSRCQIWEPIWLRIAEICPPRKSKAAIATTAIRARIRAYSARLWPLFDSPRTSCANIRSLRRSCSGWC